MHGVLESKKTDSSERKQRWNKIKTATWDRGKEKVTCANKVRAIHPIPGNEFMSY
jgi:hypothetical protein